MSDSEIGVPEHVDVMTRLPEGWKFEGLSEPRFDGANYFRAVTDPSSSFAFSSDKTNYLFFRYQLFSHYSDVTAQVRLNGELLGKTSFPKGKYAGVAEVGGFTRKGQNILSIDYRCQGQACGKPIYQYWTSIDLRPPVTLNARENVGLAAERWSPNVPDSPLRIEGALPLLFDGANYFRQVKGESFKLKWMEKTRPLSATFQIEAAEPVKVVARVNGRTVSMVSGDGSSVLSAAVPLSAFKDFREVEVEIKCSDSGVGCATLYFPALTVLPDQTDSVALQWVGGGVLSGVILFGLGRLLGFWQRKK